MEVKFTGKEPVNWFNERSRYSSLIFSDKECGREPRRRLLRSPRYDTSPAIFGGTEPVKEFMESSRVFNFDEIGTSGIDLLRKLVDAEK